MESGCGDHNVYHRLEPLGGRRRPPLNNIIQSFQSCKNKIKIMLSTARSGDTGDSALKYLLALSAMASQTVRNKTLSQL